MSPVYQGKMTIVGYFEIVTVALIPTIRKLFHRRKRVCLSLAFGFEIALYENIFRLFSDQVSQLTKKKVYTKWLF